MYRDAEGRVRWLPTAWTSLGLADPYVVLSQGRSLFCPEDLKELARRVRWLLEARGTGHV